LICRLSPYAILTNFLYVPIPNPLIEVGLKVEEIDPAPGEYRLLEAVLAKGAKDNLSAVVLGMRHEP
jgi:hypothetical protein